MDKRIAGLVVVVLSALAGPGCDGKKVDECNAVIGVYNRGLDANHAVKDDDPAGMAELGASWATIATDLGKLEITTAKLKTIAGKMKDAASSTSSALAEADKNEHAAAKVKAQIAVYGAAVNDLQTFCGVEEKK